MYLAPLVKSSLKLLGSKMGLRLLLLVIVGLGALYTIHLLAMDFMKLSAGATALFGKRDVDSANRLANITEQEIEFERKIDWNKILSRDPFNCALSLICQLSAGAQKDNEEANRIYEFISHTIEHTKVPKKLRRSYEQGLEYSKSATDDYKRCYKNYPLCPYSAEMMLKLITFNKFLFG